MEDTFFKRPDHIKTTTAYQAMLRRQDDLVRDNGERDNLARVEAGRSPCNGCDMANACARFDLACASFASYAKTGQASDDDAMPTPETFRKVFGIRKADEPKRANGLDQLAYREGRAVYIDRTPREAVKARITKILAAVR